MNKSLMAVAVVVLIGVSAAPASAAVSFGIRGTVVCPSGQPVVGIWVNSSGGGSGWASWTRYPSRPHVARYSRSFSTNRSTSISLNVGCGGTTARWATTNKTPAKAVSSGVVLYMNARCNTSTKKCAFPQLENNTPKAPATNPGADSCQCTWRASDFWKRMTGRFPNWGGNAGAWDTGAHATGWKVEAVPFADSIMVSQPTAGNSAGHVGWVADTRVKSGVLQVKVYDRNFDFKCGKRDGVWLNVASSMRFIVAPPRRETVLH